MSDTNLWIRFVLAVLATWRVTHLLASEDGPADLVVRFRVLLGDGLAGKLMDCFLCLSLWIAAPAALFVLRRPLEWIFVWLAISGAACLLEKLSSARVQPVLQGEGETYHVLRSETNGIADDSDSGDGGGPATIRLKQ